MTRPLIIAALVTIFVLGLGGASTTIGPWYRALRKPAWNPPNWLFAPAWSVIGALAAWAAALAWTQAPDAAGHQRVVALFTLNSLLNIAWSPLFFKFQRPDWALLEVSFLWLSVLALIAGLAPVSPMAGWLLAPYLAWVTFAAALNLAIVRMNAPFRSINDARQKPPPVPLR